jgi:carbohydrate kinase (thermoresistant glucokinase family)
MGLRVVVMGVSGSGKTTVGRRLCATLHVPFADADTFHTPAAVAKMSSGAPLTDNDRGPWLSAIAGWLAEHEDGGVTACSALKRAYRDVLRRGAPDAWFLYLAGSAELMRQRMAAREGHFMPAALVESQFDALEPPGDDEQAFTAQADQPPDRIVDAFVHAVGAGANR